MRTFPLLAASLVLFGCAPKDEPATPPATASAPPASGGVTPMAGGAAGGIAPVSGGMSVDGAGMGGIGNAAKDQAKRAAAAGGSSSMGANEGNEQTP